MSREPLLREPWDEEMYTPTKRRGKMRYILGLAIVIVAMLIALAARAEAVVIRNGVLCDSAADVQAVLVNIGNGAGIVQSVVSVNKKLGKNSCGFVKRAFPAIMEVVRVVRLKKVEVSIVKLSIPDLKEPQYAWAKIRARKVEYGA